MEPRARDFIRPRRPSLAVALSLAIAGLGHVYCGRIVKGLLLFLIGNVLGVVFAVTIMLKQTYWSPYVLIAWFLMLNAVWLYAVIDSWRTARGAESTYRLKDYNRWYVYLILALLWLPSLFNYATLIRAGLYEAFLVASDSMSPTLPSGSRVLADKLVYRTEPMRRGDIVVFVNPNDRHERWIKRAVALASDTVEMRGGRVYVNGDPLPRTLASDDRQLSTPECSVFWEENGDAKYLILASDEQAPTATQREFATTQVPLGHCFVLGDNRGHSYDSRHVGPIPLTDIVGRTDLLYFPEFRRLCN